MTMADQVQGKELGWNDTIEHDGSDWVLLPPGEYPFTVEKFERARFAGSAKLPPCNQAKLTLTVGDDDGLRDVHAGARGADEDVAARLAVVELERDSPQFVLALEARERDEAAIVYDPAMEYLAQFYEPERGDVILNPLDERCPFWTPGDEVPHEAEALTLAASLFPDQGRENRFFVEAPRKIFAHLLNLKPTPEQLTGWLSNPGEIDRRVKGTEMAAMIDPHGGPQRSGVLGSLNMVADAFKLLPKEPETTRRWSTTAWAKERQGWIFITSKPTVRERLRPLISLWLDLLVLRMMDDGSAAQRKTWFVLDELGSLQRLPQLTTAITESRKSNCPMILGFQGKAQILQSR